MGSYPDPVDAAQRLEKATAIFLDSLDDAQRQRAALPFDDAERRTWAYTPGSRGGIPLCAMTRAQTKVAFRLLAVLVTPVCFARVMAVISLEETLDQLEGYRTRTRHIGDYWVAAFGEPGVTPWAVRFEGHHISVNATVVEDQVGLTPLFLGANPATVRDGEHVVLAPLQVEEQLGFDLVHSLTVEQRSSAVLSNEAPPDIVTQNRPRLGGPLDPVGVPLSALNGSAAKAGRELVRTYLDRFPGGSKPRQADDLWFAWAGALEPGIGHYYRLVGQRFLVELDNTQNGANHLHTVVRDPTADFGEDLLAAHYGHSHTG
jgi:hypothetical protein